MTGRKKIVAAVIVAALAAVAGTQAKKAPAGRSFSFLQPGFTQEVFASTSSFLVPKTGYVGGIAVLPGGDVIAAECLFTGTRLHRFDAKTTIDRHSTTLHVETLLPSGGGCGLVYHPDGTLYLNTKDTAGGITNVNPATGAIIRKLGPKGNAVGIAVDPVTHHIVYTGSSCAPNTACTLYDLDPVTGVSTTFATFTAQIAYVNGIYFDPAGNYLFLDNRTPTNRLTVVTRAGGFVQHIAMPSSLTQPVGIGFSATSPAFIVTNNTDGTMSRFDFPADDYTQVPTRSVFASGGYRGDLMQAGPDGCLYATQGGTRYDNGDDEDGYVSNSIVRMCGAVQFAPPDGVPLLPPPVPMGAVHGTVTDSVSGLPLSAATVLLSNGVSRTTDASGAYSFPLSPGTYDATGSAPNYSPTIVAGIVVADGDDLTRNIALMPLPGILTGTVRTVAGDPVAGATVLLSNGKSTTTDSAGRYTIGSIVPGAYDATVSATFYDALTVTGIAVPINATATRDFTLTQTPGTLRGVVTDTGGVRLAGATVTLSGGGAVAIADATGAYAFASLTPGVYSATVTAATYSTLTAGGIVIPNAGAATKDFTLTPLPGTLQGVVTNVAGTPLNGARVQIVGGAYADTDALGRYSIGPLTPGVYVATVSASNYDTLTAGSIAIGNAATVTRNFTLTQTPGTLQGTVQNAAGAVIGGATVQIVNGPAVVSDAAGRYRFPSVMPGTYSVSVVASNYNGLTVSGIVIPNAGSVTRDFTLAQTPGTIQGVVTDAANVKLAGATVTLSNGASMVTGATGAYAFTLLTPGTYSISASAPTYIAQTASGVVLANAGTATRNFALAPMPGSLQGVVSSSAGGVVASAKVVLSNGATATADAAGKYVFAPLPPGVYGATVSAANYTDATASGIVIGNASSVTQDFTLTPIDPCKAANAYFGLGPASTYTLLGIDIDGCGYTSLDIEFKSTTIAGDLGIGASVDAYLESATVQGNLVTDPGSWVTKKKSFVVQGTTTKASLASAATALRAASVRMAKLTPTQKLAAVSASVTIKGNGGVNVVSIPTMKIVNGTVTIRGTASDIFVINMSGKFELDGSNVVLTGGVRACNILWNFTGTNISEPNEVELENGAVGAGIFLAPSRLVELLDSTHTGRVLAGGDITVYSSTIKPQ